MRLFIRVCPGILFFSILLGSPSVWCAEKSSKTSPGGKGVLEGKVIVTAPARPEEKTKSNSSYSYSDGYNGAASNSPTLPEEIIVYLEKVKGNWKPPQKHPRLDQKYTQFTRRVLPVLSGTTVDFTNNDPVYHNVFTSSKANKFDLGRRKKGETVSKVMKGTEIPVPVYCEIHRKMKSNILVLQNPFFAVVRPGESFRIPGVPAGTYQLVAWHDYWEPVKIQVTVKKGKTAKMEITLDKVQQ